MADAIDERALDRLFLEARTQNAWLQTSISVDEIRRIYDVARMGPTSANCSPARFVWCLSAAAKEKLAGFASSTNAAKIRSAPVTVIVAYDLGFADRLPALFPHNPAARGWFDAPAFAEKTAFRNSSLQGAYLMLAARALGYDCGPMSGFDNDGLDRAFFPGGRLKSNFICSIGHGSGENLFQRLPRLSFDEACRTD